MSVFITAEKINVFQGWDLNDTFRKYLFSGSAVLVTDGVLKLGFGSLDQNDWTPNISLTRTFKKYQMEKNTYKYLF